MRNSIISLGTLALLTTTVPMLALPVFAVVGTNGGTGTDASKAGTGLNGGSSVVCNSPGHEYQYTTVLISPLMSCCLARSNWAKSALFLGQKI